MKNQEKAINMYKDGDKDYRKICQLFNGYSDSEMRGNHVHHIDGNHKNNNPLNLIKCTPDEHAEFHKSEGLGNWISLQVYSLRKGQIASAEARKGKPFVDYQTAVWANYTPEQRANRIAHTTRVMQEPEYRANLSKALKGIKKPTRTKEHGDKISESKSTGTWYFGEISAVSFLKLAELINMSSVSVRRYCKDSNRVIKGKTVTHNSHIFNKQDIGTTFKQKGFNFIKNQKLGDTNE